MSEGERRGLSEGEQRVVLASLVENIVTLDGDGRITYINHVEPGLDELEVLGSRWVDWLDEATRPHAEAALRAAVKTGELQEIEFRAVGPNREQAWYYVRMVSLPESSPPGSVALLAMDITRWRRSERDLRDALQRMEQAERTAHIGHWRHDVRTGLLEPSEELLRIIGAPPGAATEDAEAFVHPDDREERRRVFGRVLAGEPYAHHEWRAVRPDGTIRYLSGSAEPVFDGSGNVVAVFGVTQDVTDRSEALQAARESAKGYRGLLENMLEGFAYCRMLYDEEGRPDDFVYLAVNPAFSRLTGLTDVEGKRVTEVIPTIKELNPELFEIYGGVAATGEPVEFDIDFAPIGKWLHVSATRPSAGEFVAFFYDVSERVEAESFARESEERLRRSLAAAGAGTWEWDLRTDENTWADELWDLYGLDRDGREASLTAWLESVRPEDRAAVQEKLSMAVATGRELSFEWRVNTRDGSPRWLLSRGSPEHGEDGEIVRYLGVVVDVTERRLALKALREREESYAAVFNEAPFGILVSRLKDAVIVSANKAFLELFEGTPDEVIGRTIPDLGIADPGTVAAMTAELRAHGAVRDREAVRRTLTGREVMLSINLARVSIGGEDHVLTSVRDITEARRGEQALQESEERFRSLFEHSPMGVFFGRPDGFVTAANPAACRMFGFSEDEIIAGGRDRLLDPEDPRLRPALEERARSGRVHAVELTAIRGDGSRFPVELDSFVVGGDPPRSFWMLRDITQRLEMESSLRESEAEARETVERLTRAQRLGHMGDWEWDVSGGDVHWSEEVYRIYGVEPDFETTFDAIVAMTHPEDAAQNLREAQAIVDDAERSSAALSFRIVRPDGGVRHIFQTLAVDRDAGGVATRLFGIMQDVSEVREAEAALLQSERRLSRFYDAGLVGVVFWTAEGAITDANDRFLEMLGYAREELDAGRVNWAAMTPPKWEARDRRSLEELRTTGRSGPFEKEYYRKDGAPLPILVTAATLDDEGRHGIALILDISDQKRAEESLRRLNLELEERVRRRTMDLEAANAELESFSYSVSHDLRAPLRHIAGFAKLLEEHLGSCDEETHHFVEVITRSTSEMGVLIDDLLRFSRVGRAEMHFELVDVEQLVREVLDVGTSDLGDRRVEVTVGEVASAVGDRTLLRQVWANLIGNALKYTRPRDPAVIEIGSRRESGETVYWVKDNGVGFDMQYAARLFRVFERLHRSEEYEGSGIGLANVLRIVGRHGGRCWVEAANDVGATFFFALPAGTED